MPSEQTPAQVKVTQEAHVTISAKDLTVGLTTMICPQCVGVKSSNGLCPLCSDSGKVVRSTEEAAALYVGLRWAQIDKLAKKDTGDEGEDGYNVGVSDGFQEAVQYIDARTGGDGEYRVSTDPERHCPDPATMIVNIIDHIASHREAAERRVVENIVERIKADAKLCDCFARSEGECACGAWDDHKSVPLYRVIEIIANRGDGNG